MKANVEHDFSLFYLDQRHQAMIAVAFLYKQTLIVLAPSISL